MTRNVEGFEPSDPDAVGITVEVSDVVRWFDTKRAQIVAERRRIEGVRLQAGLQNKLTVLEPSIRFQLALIGAQDEVLTELGKILTGEVMMPPLPIDPLPQRND